MTKNTMHIIHVILDCGHGMNDTTNGKYSPLLEPSEFDLRDVTVYQNRFREGNFNRLIGQRLERMLKEAGFAVHVVSDSYNDNPLSDRVKKANEIAKKYGKENCIYVSIHSNASGTGIKWKDATGASVHCCRKSSEASRKLARLIYKHVLENGYNGNRSIPEDHIWYNDFFVLKNTKMPAVLVENLFYDNKSDLKKLMSDEHRDVIVSYLYHGILEFIVEGNYIKK